MEHAMTPADTQMIVLTVAEYEALLSCDEDATDIAALRTARAESDGESTLPADLLTNVFAGSMHPLTAWREASSLTIAALADRTGVRPATISEIENGKVDPRYSTVKALADALGVDVDSIMP